MSFSISDFRNGTSTVITEVSVSDDGQILLFSDSELEYIINPVCAVRAARKLMDAATRASEELSEAIGGK